VPAPRLARTAQLPGGSCAATTRTYAVKTSTDRHTRIPAAGGVNDSGAAVEVTLPAGAGRIFARIEVSVP